ncbi:MAG: MoaD/ThiS family protein [Gammaproteobacteria bacterium]
MSIKVRYFASLQESVGRSEDILEPGERMTARDVWRLSTRANVLPANVLVAINMDYADWDSVVSDGDEIAFFPPVTGGMHDGQNL